MTLPSNVTLHIGSLIVSMTQEEHNNGRLNVAVFQKGEHEFIPTSLWSPAFGEDSDVVSYVGASDLVAIIHNVQRLADFATLTAKGDSNGN